MKAPRCNLKDLIVICGEMLRDLDRLIGGDSVITSQLAEVIVSDGEETVAGCLLFVRSAPPPLSGQEVTRPSRKGDVNDVKLLINVEEVKLEEVGEVLAEGTDLLAQSQLSKLVFALD